MTTHQGSRRPSGLRAISLALCAAACVAACSGRPADSLTGIGGLVPRGVYRSAISSDGLTFTRESGIRISSAALGFTASGVSNIVRTADGMWRAYFSDLPLPGTGPMPHAIRSARSADLMTWEFNTGITEANDPDLVPLPDGSVRIYYNWGGDSGGWVSSSLYVGAPFAPARTLFHRPLPE